MRQVVLDTETTGLEVDLDHRIIEIGCVEIVDRRITRRNLHKYVNPERDSDEGALEVHGLTREFLADKPLFADVVDEFLAFVKDSELIIHNAAFDVGFINHELRKVSPSLGRIEDYCTITDSLAMARQKHPGQKNSLDALCKRYDVDNSQRTLHGALLDAEILADVYLLLTGGQVTLSLGQDEERGSQPGGEFHRLPTERKPLKVVYASRDEVQRHKEKLRAIEKASGGPSIWQKLDEAESQTVPGTPKASA